MASRSGVLIASLALVVSALVAATLVVANLNAVMRVRQSRVLGTIVPASGTLAGQVSGSDADWKPSEDATRVGVLFGIADQAGRSGMEFWQSVAARVGRVDSRIEFVGLCLNARLCMERGWDPGRLTLLSAMDPTQTHALASAAKEGRAFLFRGASVRGVIPIGDDVDRYATLLQKLPAQSSEEGP